MNKVHKILDHGELVLVDSLGNDLSVVRSARVSYDGKGTSTDERLINYLMKHDHNTPFESVVATFQIKAPIFVVRQWHRHRTQSYNEISARYAELPEEFYVPEVSQITTQSKDNKQMRTDDVHPLAEEMRQVIETQNSAAFKEYKTLISQGCPRELARTVLPVGTYTKMFATANLVNWLKFLRERLHPHAQYEIRVYAEAILEELENVAPVAVQAFKTHKMGN